MATTEKKAVMVYIDEELEARLKDWCLGAKLTRRVAGERRPVAALGTGVHRILELFLGDTQEDQIDELEERVARLEKTLIENNNAK